MRPDRYVRRFDNRSERLVNPQDPLRMEGGKPVTHTGYILPYGRGGYRHSFGGCGDCGCVGCMGGTEQWPTLWDFAPYVVLLSLLGLGGWFVYSLLRK